MAHTLVIPPGCQVALSDLPPWINLVEDFNKVDPEKHNPVFVLAGGCYGYLDAASFADFLCRLGVAAAVIETVTDLPSVSHPWVVNARADTPRQLPPATGLKCLPP